MDDTEQIVKWLADYDEREADWAGFGPGIAARRVILLTRSLMAVHGIPQAGQIAGLRRRSRSQTRTIPAMMSLLPDLKLPAIPTSASVRTFVGTRAVGCWSSARMVQSTNSDIPARFGGLFPISLIEGINP